MTASICCWYWMYCSNAKRQYSTDDIGSILKFQKFIAQLILLGHLFNLINRKNKNDQVGRGKKMREMIFGINQRMIIIVQKIMIQIILVALGVVAIVWIAIAMRVDWNKRRDKGYYEITLFLGSGGHTGQLCQMLHNFRMDKVAKLNVVITQTDKTSENFFKNYIKKDHVDHEMQILNKTNIYYLARTNEVKQSYITAIFTFIRSLIKAFILIITKLINSTHFVSNGPGTSVPIFYIFAIIKMAKLSRVKLIFIQSWCRVKELSLTGKLVKPITNEFIVHWPELAAKYKNCKYFERML